jgi:ABC-type transport system involved in multi-copper enzyme maturation permease subunit
LVGFAAMPPVFWIGVGFGAVIFFVSLTVSARSRSGTLATGAAIGLFMGLMLAFPLIALGLATS